MRLLRATALVAALLSAPMAAYAEGPQEAAAHVRFTKGRELFMANKFAEAAAEFRAANELFASPNTRLYIARCERELGHPAAAYIEFQRAASEAADRARSDPKYVATRDTARQEGQALEGKFGRLVIKAKDAQGMNVTVGGNAIAAAALGVPTPMDPGTVEVAATAKGKLPFKQKIAIKAGETTEIAIALEPDPGASVEPPSTTTNETPPAASETPPSTQRERPNPEPPRMIVEHSGGGVRIAGIFVIAAGVAGFGGFAIFGAVAQSTYDELRTIIADKRPLPNDYYNRISDGERNQTIANVMLGIGIGGLVVGGVMFAVGGETTTTRPAQARARTMPMLSIGPGGGYIGAVREF
jgi:tetratricopeptide (TPR) repeat protein